MAEKEPAGELRLAGVTKRFGAVAAVDDLDLTVPQGSFFALLGPSGCGKTTTLRIVAGLEQPTAGRVFLAGRDVTDLRPYRRPVNTVFQSYALFPHLDVFGNVAFGLRRRGVPDPAGRVARMLAMVRLDGFERRRPTELSGGQQQRVALARALVNEPRVLLLDEPLSALDPRLRRQMQIELKRIQTDVGATFVHVTHDQEEAMTLADTVAVLNAGRVEQFGAPADLYDLPATAFVANFLGQANLLAGRVTGRAGGDVLVEAYGSRFSVPADRSRSGAGAVLVGVRPERLHLAAAAADVPAGHQWVTGVVTDSSYVGVGTRYLVRTLWGAELAAFAAYGAVAGGGAAAAAGDPAPGGAGRLPVGAEVVAYWNPAHAFLVPDDVDPGPAGIRR
ncbi:ABC transporter ATP-binding protein [Polymorphospora rubra]|uniref:ABC transporter ATP-binding protein n=1 Tax=Polymorphospora rubra TaxID=338584 RepID=UPI0033E4073B